VVRGPPPVLARVRQDDQRRRRFGQAEQIEEVAGPDGESPRGGTGPIDRRHQPGRAKPGRKGWRASLVGFEHDGV